MDTLLIAARAVHYASTISLAGVFAFLCLVPGPNALPRLRRRLALLAWASLLLGLASGAAWLLLLSARLGGRPLGAALAQGVVTTVLTATRFGRLWIVRLGLAGLLAAMLTLHHARRGPLWRWTGLALAGALLASLAWAGHGGATPGLAGDLHLGADILHLLAAGAWLGGLVPLALLLAEFRGAADAGAAALARRAVSRFSLVAACSVAVLFTAGLVITWFLAGSAPALIGTAYGRLLLAKIAIFLTMVTVGAINLLRLSPRLAPSAALRELAPPGAALGHLRRNALIEAGLGLGVLGIVAILGTLPPGLHTEPRWPLPFRLELAGLAGLSKLGVALAIALAIGAAAAGVAAAARGRYRYAAAAGGGLAIAVGLGALLLQPAVAPAYPTSFFAPTEPYAAATIVRGARLYAANCAVCHGADGRGDGPAAATLRVRPADLTAPHLFAHSAGDLYWWIGHGKGGAMPGFAGVLRPSERWAVIDFVRARAAGLLSRKLGPRLSTGIAPAVPDFAFEADGRQQTLDRLLKTEPALLVLLSGAPSPARLTQLAAAREQLAAAGVPLVAVALAQSAAAGREVSPARAIYPAAHDVAAALALFRDPGDGGETDLLLDRAGRVRARWTAEGGDGLPDAAIVAAEAAQAARLPGPTENHAGHAH